METAQTTSIFAQTCNKTIQPGHLWLRRRRGGVVMDFLTMILAIVVFIISLPWSLILLPFMFM